MTIGTGQPRLLCLGPVTGAALYSAVFSAQGKARLVVIGGRVFPLPIGRMAFVATTAREIPAVWILMTLTAVTRLFSARHAGAVMTLGALELRMVAGQVYAGCSLVVKARVPAFHAPDDFSVGMALCTILLELLVSDQPWILSKERI